MNGYYLSLDDERFLELITDELDKYQSQNETSFILLFPRLTARHRLLLHQIREKNYPNLFSFSVGIKKNSRRTIICLKSQLMEETNITPSSDNTSTASQATASVTTDNSNGDSNRRRPAQALYQPPRRSKNLENPKPVPTSPPPPTPPPVAVVEDVQSNSSIAKPTKSKTARPSAEPYVPPSRRSQTLNKESLPTASSTTLDNKKENDTQDDEEDDWEKLLDNNEITPQTNLVEEIQTKLKETLQIKKPTNDYSTWSVDDMQIKEADFAHIVEVSNFPSTFRTEDISGAFRSITRSIFDIKWVDETHALVVFPDANTALDALQMEHPMLKICSMSQASPASKKKAKNTAEFLQPYKTRPQTSSLTANRRICAALGLKNPMSSDKTKTERQKIESARQQKIRDKEEQKTVWDGGVLPTTSST